MFDLITVLLFDINSVRHVFKIVTFKWQLKNTPPVCIYPDFTVTNQNNAR